MAPIIDLEKLLQPIADDSPAGENLRYTQVYDDIKEARRADDTLDRGDWQQELKTSDWDQVVKLSLSALSEKTKDLQIAAWLTEALMQKYSFVGITEGMELLTALMESFWDDLYPEMDDDDLDYRIAPLEFILDKMAIGIKFLPITDKNKTTACSLLKLQEAKMVGYEKDTVDQYGDKDRSKLEKRLAAIEDGKMTAEDLDSCIAATEKEFYLDLAADVAACSEQLNQLEVVVDSKFGLDGPGFGAARGSLEEFTREVNKILKDNKGGADPAAAANDTAGEDTTSAVASPVAFADGDIAAVATDFSPSEIPAGQLSDIANDEQAMWTNALKTLAASGIKQALQQLYNASCMSPSIRQKNRYRLLMGKLCLKADRTDLARPILEELYSLIDDLNLARWESPVWIGEVIETLYQCLTTGDPSRQDNDRASDLLLRLCTTDVTKAMTYRDPRSAD
jgi:type VI secretion system protein ImpA